METRAAVLEESEDDAEVLYLDHPGQPADRINLKYSNTQHLPASASSALTSDPGEPPSLAILARAEEILARLEEEGISRADRPQGLLPFKSTPNAMEASHRFHEDALFAEEESLWGPMQEGGQLEAKRIGTLDSFEDALPDMDSEHFHLSRYNPRSSSRSRTSVSTSSYSNSKSRSSLHSFRDSSSVSTAPTIVSMRGAGSKLGLSRL